MSDFLKVTTNSNELVKNLERRSETMEKDLLKAVERSTREVMNTAKQGIHGPPKSGVMRASDGHIASAPGEYPASDTGHLASMIAHKLYETKYEGRVTSSAKYGVYLEYGTMNMAARPFMFPSLEKNRRKILKRFKDAVGKYTKDTR